VGFKNGGEKLRRRSRHIRGAGEDQEGFRQKPAGRKQREGFFSRTKRSKKTFYAGPEALSATSPWPGIKEVFAQLFSKSGHFF
jgi:hypothetical protein